MSHETPASLPSLAHPLILGKENDEQIRIPPFSEIDLNWAGFERSIR
jgi:hypothetical protein